MMIRESLLSSLKGLSKDVYSRGELLPEMDQLEKEMAQIVFEDGLDIPAEYVHMSYIMKHLHEMNNAAGNVADQELKRLSRLASIFSNHVRTQQSGITGEDRVEQYLDYMKSNHVVLRNLQLSDGVHNTEIDFLVLKQGVATIVEVKNSKRDIYIDEVGDMYKIGRYENFDSHLGAKMDFRAEVIKQLQKDAGFENMKIEKVVVFTNNRIQVQKDYRGFRVCFLSRLPHLIDDFYGTGVIQFTKHLQQIADFIQSKDLNEYYPFDMDIQEFKEAFVDAYLKIKGYDQPKPIEDGLFTRVRVFMNSLFNMHSTQHVSL
ncbi:NERD domain-containing protein [Holdemanella biformis]|uniref:NERD domain-containing protein n=1 Tax=Holdemanella porci TaxID=2652276 RepID=A0A6N7VHQ3_9FIRM|nr:nuclease-related domain-containing protein [Holdemanella porci]MSS56422.1 NERD domain-containing protein [Holdemanella porci]